MKMTSRARWWSIILPLLFLALWSGWLTPSSRAEEMTQPIHSYRFPISSGDVRYYTDIGSDCGLVAGGPSVQVSQDSGELHILTKTVGWSTSYGGLWHSTNETATNSTLVLNAKAALPWPIAASSQVILKSWYARVKGKGDFKVELKKDGNLLKEWKFNGFDEDSYTIVGADLPSDLTTFKLFNIVAETDSSLYFDEVGFKVEVPTMSRLRYAFLTSAGQVLRCYGEKGVRDRSNWPEGDFDNVPGLGFAALTAACAYDLGMVKLADAQTLAKNSIANLLAVPAHSSGWLPHWTKSEGGVVIRHPDSETSTVDTALAYLPSYLSSIILKLEPQRLQILARIKKLNFAAVTTSKNELSHGFDKNGVLIPYTWNAWGGESQLLFILAKMNNRAKNYARDTTPAVSPHSPVPNGTGFIMEIAGLLSAKFGGQNVGPDRYGADWYQNRLKILLAQKAAFKQPSFIGGLSAGEIVSGAGNTRYHVGGTDPLKTGETGFDSPWVAPHYMAMTAAIDIANATNHVNYMIGKGLMPPLAGPAEAVLYSSNWSIRRYHTMQGVLNGFFSTIGYYHAVALAEKHDDAIYRAGLTDKELYLDINSLFAPGSAVDQNWGLYN